MIDTFYGALAQFLHIFLGQKQEKCDFRKKWIFIGCLEHKKDTFFIHKKSFNHVSYNYCVFEMAQ